MKTAIEWLEQHLKELENKVFNFEVSPFESPVIREDLYKQAKAMEKEQICNAYTDGLEGPYLGAEEYHNRTYNQKGIDAGIFLADLLTKELEELGDEDLEPREDIKLEEGVEMFKIGGETDEEKAYRMGGLNGYDEGVYDGENK